MAKKKNKKSVTEEFESMEELNASMDLDSFDYDKYKEEKVNEVASLIKMEKISVEEALQKASMNQGEFFSIVRNSPEFKEIILEAAKEVNSELIQFDLPHAVLKAMLKHLENKPIIEKKTIYSGDMDEIIRTEVTEKERLPSLNTLIQLASIIHPQLNPNADNSVQLSELLQSGIIFLPDGPGIPSQNDGVEDVEIEEIEDIEDIEE